MNEKKNYELNSLFIHLKVRDFFEWKIQSEMWRLYNLHLNWIWGGMISFYFSTNYFSYKGEGERPGANPDFSKSEQSPVHTYIHVPYNVCFLFVLLLRIWKFVYFIFISKVIFISMEDGGIGTSLIWRFKLFHDERHSTKVVWCSGKIAP